MTEDKSTEQDVKEKHFLLFALIIKTKKMYSHT